MSRKTGGREPSGPTPWKAAEPDHHQFHYNREERDAGRRHVWEPPTGSFFRRNRALTLTIIDVAIVLVLFVIFLFVIRPFASRTDIGDYRFQAEAILFDGEVMVAVTVTDTAFSSGGEPPADNVVTVAVGERQVADLLPTTSAQRTIRLRAPADAVRSHVHDGEISVTVVLGSEERRLTVPTSGESWDDLSPHPQRTPQPVDPQPIDPQP